MSILRYLVLETFLGLLALTLFRSVSLALLVACASFSVRASRYVRHSSVRLGVFVCACDAVPLYGMFLRVSAARISLVVLSLSVAAYSVWEALRVYHLCRLAGLPHSSLRKGTSRTALRAWRSAFRLQAQVFPGIAPAWALLVAMLSGSLHILDEQGEVVALAVVHQDALPGVNWLSYLAVAADRRQQGYGRKLLSLVGPVALTVREGNVNALALYRSTGFCEAVRWENYYGHGQVGLLMVSRSAS